LHARSVLPSGLTPHPSSLLSASKRKTSVALRLQSKIAYDYPLQTLCIGNAMPLEIRPLVDYAFKRVFGSSENVQSLISFLNAVLSLRHPIAEITLLNPFNDKEYDKDKLSILDIRAKDSTGATFIVEVQLTMMKGLVKRWVYYTCKQAGSQLGEGAKYVDLRPVYTVCILDGKLWPESKKLHHCFRLTDAESGISLGETIEIHTLELGKYNVKEAELVQASLLEQWLYWMIHANEYEVNELRKLLPDSNVGYATQVLENIKMQSVEYERYLQREKALRDEGWLAEAAKKEGIQIGELIGKIKALQGVLSLRVASTEELRGMPESVLESQLADLQSQIRNRPQSS
jgi:predicted transposase/invertase (TIGR01784 family)